jgi:peptidyl-prolyl cis-trans isomerase SurA
MKTLFACSLVMLAATSLQAQQSAGPKPPDSKVPLDAIVATVNDVPITRYDLDEMILTKIQRGEIKTPPDSATGMAVRAQVLDDMIQDELIIQKAKDLKIDVPDADISPQVDRQVKDVRSKYTSEADFRNALVAAALGSPEEYRKFLMEQYRRQLTREKVIRKLTQDGKIIPVNVTDAEIAAEYEKSKEFIPKKPASVTFKQIVIASQPSPKAKEVARVKAESLLAELKAGTDFEKLAKRESMDLLTKETGGDIGWTRRDQNIPEYNRWLFGSPFQAALSPGDLSPVVETAYGYFIIRVDRVQPGEVKAHQILIRPVVDSADVARTKLLADSVAMLLKGGAPFDSLAKKYNDYAGKEETNILTPFERDSLPIPYQKAFLLRKAGDVSVFQIPGGAQNPTVPKFVVAQLLTVDEGGDRTLDDIRAYVRQDLAQRGGLRRYIDGLRKQAYVAVTLDGADTSPKSNR